MQSLSSAGNTRSDTHVGLVEPPLDARRAARAPAVDGRRDRSGRAGRPPRAAPARRSSDSPPPVPRPASAGRLVRFGRALTRPRRVLLALAAVWVVSAFDLYFTLQERAATHFVELNPLARALLDGPPWVVATFKFGLLVFGSGILIALRRYSVTEWAAWFLLAVKIYVGVRWLAYFDSLVTDKFDPLVTWPPGG